MFEDDRVELVDVALIENLDQLVHPHVGAILQ